MKQDGFAPWTPPPMTHVVALSGGKDSTALALRLAEVEPRDYVYVITPTGNEPPDMIEHWHNLAKILGSPLKVVTCGKSLQGLIREEGMLPRFNARYCTPKLKLEPYFKWLDAHYPATCYVGLRYDEETREGALGLDKVNAKVRYPLREWGWDEATVWKYLRYKRINIPERTDCMLCFWQRIGEWYNLWKNNPEAYAEGEALEAYATEYKGSQASFRMPGRDTWPTTLKALRERFEGGAVPTTSLKMMDKRRQIGQCRACTL